MGKKKDKVTIRCVGMSSCEVTGSGYLVECPTGEKVLLDCGIYQSSKPYEDYKINKRKFDFKPSELTAVIISHGQELWNICWIMHNLLHMKGLDHNYQIVLIDIFNFK